MVGQSQSRMMAILTVVALATFTLGGAARAQQQTVNGCAIRAQTVCAKANLSRANLRGVNLTGAVLTEANLSHANLSLANLAGANLSGDVTAPRMMSGDKDQGKMGPPPGANLSYANLTGANLTGANLTGANLTGANLTGATLTGANLTGVTWFNGRICGPGSIGVCKWTP